MYVWDFSRSVGDGSATNRKAQGLVRSVMRLMTPPFICGVSSFEEHTEIWPEKITWNNYLNNIILTQQ
jgi:hypothetical protein